MSQAVQMLREPLNASTLLSTASNRLMGVTGTSVGHDAFMISVALAEGSLEVVKGSLLV